MTSDSWQGAGALIFDDVGQVLLIRQNYGGRYYALPGARSSRARRRARLRSAKSWKKPGCRSAWSA